MPSAQFRASVIQGHGHNLFHFLTGKSSDYRYLFGERFAQSPKIIGDYFADSPNLYIFAENRMLCDIFMTMIIGGNSAMTVSG